MPYTTKQQQAVLHLLESCPLESLTAAALSEDLRRAGSPVGLATIYRQLDRLERLGLVHKINTEEGALYQYCDHAAPQRDCFLLKCAGCGRILHLDCSQLRGLYDHLEQTHHFRIDPRATLFSGLCDVCAAKEDAHGSN
ncbi:MAG: transcriptional repressor [Oscillibacter sp.]